MLLFGAGSELVTVDVFFDSFVATVMGVDIHNFSIFWGTDDLGCLAETFVRNCRIELAAHEFVLVGVVVLKPNHRAVIVVAIEHLNVHLVEHAGLGVKSLGVWFLPL